MTKFSSLKTTLVAFLVIFSSTAFGGQVSQNVGVTAQVMPKCVISAVTGLTFGQLTLADDGTSPPVLANGSFTVWCSAGTVATFNSIISQNSGSYSGQLLLASGNMNNAAQKIPYLLNAGFYMGGLTYIGAGPSTPMVFNLTGYISDYRQSLVGIYSDNVPINITY